MSVTLMGHDVAQKRQEILEYFYRTFDTDEALYGLLKSDKSFFEQPNHLRHPLIFYYGHTATFYVNKFLLAGLVKERLDEHFESVFAIGVDEMSWDDLNSANYAWPSVEEVRAYRKRVRELVGGIIEGLEFTLPITPNSPMWAVLMGIEHQNIHIETSSVLLRELDLAHLNEGVFLAPMEESEGEAPCNSLLHVKGEAFTLGENWDAPTHYGWDNEFGTHEVTLVDFEASQYLVSNGEFKAFVETGAYERGEYFSQEGKAYLGFTKAKAPKFWRNKGGAWVLRQISREIALPLEHPVEVSFYEAEAFCAWKSARLEKAVRLPSEDEYYALARFTHAFSKEANVGLKKGSAVSVNAHEFGDFYDVRGNVWQWSITPIYPYEGFRTHPWYDDFTVPTFDDRHALIKGGSFVSLGNETLPSARYAFRKHFYQHAGFRYVHSTNAAPTHLNTNIYETDALLSQYCDMHYGGTHFGVPNFPKHVVELLLPYAKARGKALDLGCSVGRASFELAKHFDAVEGIDFSANFIRVGVALQQKGTLTYNVPTEGELRTSAHVNLKELGLEDGAQKVGFFQGDACNLKPHFSGYDVVLCSNLIDRLRTPQLFLESIGERLNKGGLLVLVSPYSWDEAYTPKEAWLGGFYREGRAVHTLENLQTLLKEWSLLGCHEVPFVIQETARKFQHTLSQMSVWKKG